ncbi:Vacuolar protein sorting-associated protein 53, partial [Spiromyces aspiralis]
MAAPPPPQKPQASVAPTSTTAGAAVSEDPLELDQFTVSSYIDYYIRDEKSLENIDVVLENIRYRLRSAKKHLDAMLHNSRVPDSDELQEIEHTKTSIQELYGRIANMRAKSHASERAVYDITQDIKTLDYAKRNVSETIKTFKRLQMLVNASDQFEQIIGNRNYRDAVYIVQAIDELTANFSSFERIPRVAELKSRIASQKKSLVRSIYHEFESGFDTQGTMVGNAATLRHACLAADVLKHNEREHIIEYYCDLQLNSYKAIFQLSDD